MSHVTLESWPDRSHRQTGWKEIFLHIYQKDIYLIVVSKRRAMIPFFVLTGVFIVCRLLGLAGAEFFTAWQHCPARGGGGDVSADGLCTLGQTSRRSDSHGAAGISATRSAGHADRNRGTRWSHRHALDPGH